MIGVVPSALVYMPTYEFARHALRGTPFAPFAGCVTGVVSACVRVPTSVLKVRARPPRRFRSSVV